MPGLIAFKRRWSVGSDDLVIPGSFLFFIHIIWLIILSTILILFEYNNTKCVDFLWCYIIAYICVLTVTSVVEFFIIFMSMRGSILNTTPRESIPVLLYIKIIMMIIDIGSLSAGTVWFKNYYHHCPIYEPKEIVLSSIICNWIVECLTLSVIFCSYDPAGRSWVKMKKYQRSMRESESRFNYKRSGSRSRNWRQRKVMRQYENSWNTRCKLLFCCMSGSERTRNSFTDIARLLSDFFRDLDVVPSDVVAGLILLRKFQKLEREAIVRQKKNGTYKFLSGVPIRDSTKFLALNDCRDYEHFKLVTRYCKFALGAYGWPMFIANSKTGVCQLFPKLCCGRKSSSEIIEDNCCFCHYAALKKMIPLGDVEIMYATFHVEIGETPFFIALDYEKEKIVISIRGTLSMKDILTDLNAEGECLPLTPPREDWLGHKGMVQAAVYIKNKLKEENLIERALNHNTSKNTHNFGIICVGHSLGAGTASILTILLKSEYSSLQCFSFSPPGGLLSMPCVEYSKSFITSVVLAKDFIPRLGINQMEALRADLINAISRSVDPKWKTIACSMICCCCGPEPKSVIEMSTTDSNINAYNQQKVITRNSSHHPSDTHIALTLHQPLYPPGRIIHVLRRHTNSDEQILGKKEPFIFQAIWADSKDFDEVLISPAMLEDHMPDKVLAALEKCITHIGPRKPQRQTSSITSEHIDPTTETPSTPTLIQFQNNFNSQLTPTTAARNMVHLETSFTNLQSSTKNLESTIDTIKPISNSEKLKSVTFTRNGSNSYSKSSKKFNPTTLSLCETRPNPFGKKVDLIYDDWFGNAPLASSESSSISSISSRIALNMNLTNSIEKCLNKMENNKNSHSSVTTPSTVPETTIIENNIEIEVFESQMHTPKVMRRTPKFSINLSNVNDADNLAYKRMGQVFITNSFLTKTLSSESNSTSSNDERSFETAQSFSKPGCCIDNKSILRNLPDGSSKSADNIDENMNLGQNSKFISDTAVHCNSGCPICPCTKLNPEECCQKSDHISCILLLAQQKHGKHSITNTTSSSDTYYTMSSSDCGFIQQNNKLGANKFKSLEGDSFNSTTISSITRSGILESHFPVYVDSSDENRSLYDSPQSKNAFKHAYSSPSPQKRGSTNADIHIAESGFIRNNESLPLLSNLVDKSSPNNFVKRKIHPISTTSPINFPNRNPNESSV